LDAKKSGEIVATAGLVFVLSVTEPFWAWVMDFGIEVVDLIKLACARAEYLIINGLSA
jgi:hypothetical protein